MKPQVILLAGGASSRFFPFNVQHKSLFMVCGKPVLYWTLLSIRKAGIDQVVIVTNGDGSIEQLVNTYPLEGLNIEYVVQPEPLGAGDAILRTKDFIKSDFFIVNSQNYLFDIQAKSLIDHGQKYESEVVLCRTTTDTPEKYGILALEGDRVVDVIEKPSNQEAPSKWRIVGTYLCQQGFLKRLEQTPKEHYQLETALADAAKNSRVESVALAQGEVTLKYPWDLFSLKDGLLDTWENPEVQARYIAPTAVIRGNVIIEPGVEIHDYAIVEGPAYLGKNSLVGQFCIVRKGTVLEEGAHIERYCDVKNSLIGAHTHIHSGFIGDSIIGENCRIGAGFITANKRIDRQSVQVTVKGEVTDSGLKSLGTLMGSNLGIGVNVSTMPGTVLGSNSVIGPSLTVKGNFPQESNIRQSNI